MWAHHHGGQGLFDVDPHDGSVYVSYMLHGIPEGEYEPLGFQIGKILPDGSNLQWGYQATRAGFASYIGGSVVYDHVSDEHVFFMADRDWHGAESFLIVRKTNKVDGSQVFYKGYQDNITRNSDKWDGAKPCALNSDEHLLCLFPKLWFHDVALYKIDGSSEGEPLSGLFIDYVANEFDFYDSIAIGPDDKVFIHLEKRGGTRLFLVLDK